MVAQPAQPPIVPSSTPEAAQTEATPIDQILDTLILAKLQSRSPQQQQQVLDFVEFLKQRNPPQSPQKTIWEKIRENTARIPPEEWENMPTDGSYQHDHYLYGTPKREL